MRNWKEMNLEAKKIKTGISTQQIATHLNVNRNTVLNWQKLGRVPSKYKNALDDLFHPPGKEWLWSIDDEPSSMSWAIKQSIAYLRKAIAANEEEKLAYLETVIAVSETEFEPRTGNALKHSVDEKHCLRLIGNKAKYFIQERKSEAINSFVSSAIEHEGILVELKNHKKFKSLLLDLENGRMSYIDIEELTGHKPLQIRVCVENKIEHIISLSKSNKISHNDTIEYLRFLQLLVSAMLDENADILYPHLHSKLCWNEVHVHCVAGSESYKHAYKPLSKLVNRYGRHAILQLVLRDSIVSNAFADSDITELLGYKMASSYY